MPKPTPTLNRRLLTFGASALCLSALLAGCGKPAAPADNGVVAHHVNHNGSQGFEAVSDAGFVPEQYGFAVKKGNTELLRQLNQGLAAIRADGTHQRLLAGSFGDAR